MFPFLIVIIFLVHWIADAVCQSNEMAVKKSSSLFFLTFHVVVYSTIWFLFIWTISLGDMEFAAKFTAITFVSHWIIDFFSSKITRKLAIEAKKNNENYHNFFVAILGDQALHHIQLILSFYYLLPS